MKKLSKLIFLLFLLVNIIAGFHAYQFTHFSEKISSRTNEKNITRTFDKIKLAAFGIDNPRPENTMVPDRPFETIFIQSNKKLACWKIKADSAKGVVILFHGYVGKKSDMLDRAYVFLDHHYDVLMVDFMGSGGSEGNSTTVGFREAQQVKDCYDHIKGTGEKNIFLFGTSMGAAAILKCLNDHLIQPSAVLLECPFGSMYQTVCARFKLMGYPSFPMAGILLFWGGVQNGFWAFSHNPAEYARKVQCPAMLLYGEKDDRVSRQETLGIYSNLAGKKQLALYPECGHESYVPKDKDKWTEDVFSFLNELP
jgi:alpha-beta hydrolase superfamily lysophospholipase